MTQQAPPPGWPGSTELAANPPATSGGGMAFPPPPPPGSAMAVAPFPSLGGPPTEASAQAPATSPVAQAVAPGPTPAAQATASAPPPIELALAAPPIAPVPDPLLGPPAASNLGAPQLPLSEAKPGDGEVSLEASAMAVPIVKSARANRRALVLLGVLGVLLLALGGAFLVMRSGAETEEEPAASAKVKSKKKSKKEKHAATADAEGTTRVAPSAKRAFPRPSARTARPAVSAPAPTDASAAPDVTSAPAPGTRSGGAQPRNPRGP